MIKVAEFKERGPNSVVVVIEGDNPSEVTDAAATKLALDECGLGGTKSLDPLLRSGSYPVDSRGAELQFGQPVPPDVRLPHGHQNQFAMTGLTLPQLGLKLPPVRVAAIYQMLWQRPPATDAELPPAEMLVLWLADLLTSTGILTADQQSIALLRLAPYVQDFATDFAEQWKQVGQRHPA